MKIREIKEIVDKKNWSLLVAKYSVSEICKSLSFREAMHLTETLFYDNMDNDEIQQYALNLTLQIKSHFADEWEADWKNEVYLGYMFSFLWQYEERYNCYKNAYDKMTDPPPALLLLLSGCNSAPGTPPISDEVAEEYLMRANEKKVTYESAVKMRALYRQKRDKVKEEFWDNLCEELQNKNVHTESIVPDILQHTQK